MSTNKLFKVFSSSAGSGKTFTLAKEYIKLLLTSHDSFYFQKILAVTFTNDAANEMKSRILEYLEVLSYVESVDNQKIEKRDFLIKILLEDINEFGPEITKELLQERAKLAFSSIIHNYSDFSVSTIDSFIQKIVNAFAIQLGFLNTTEIVLDADEILLPAAENFIAKVGFETEKSLSEAILEYVEQLAVEGKNWNYLPKSFADFAKNLFSDSKLKYLERIQDMTLESVREISTQLFDYLLNTEESIRKITQLFINICENNNVDQEDFLRGKGGGILSVFIKRNQGSEIFKSFTKTVLGVHNDEWYSKTSKKKEVIDAVKSDLYQIFTQYESLIEEEKAKYLLLKAIHKNLFKLSLLTQFKIEINAIKAEAGMVHISEFNKAILNVVSNEPVPYIYERIGERYQHIMIDEFQDTSPIQFQNFLPLFANSLSNNHFCLVVGDPKQAIYRFRGGDMTQIIHLFNNQLDTLKKGINPDSFLIENLEQIKPHLEGENLKINYRSFSEIIDFNNDLFGFIKNHKPFQEEFKLLESAFDDSYFQAKPANIQSGAHIQITFKQSEEEQDVAFTPEGEAEQVNDKSKFEDSNILKIVRECLEDGYDYKDIAILCRKKEVAKVLANYLKANGMPIISSDSILLSNSNSVNFVVDIMGVIINNSSYIRYQCFCHFHKFILNKEIPTEDAEIRKFIDNEDIGSLFKYFNSFGYDIDLSLLVGFSLCQLGEYLINCFRLFENKAEQEYLFAFLDEIINFKNKKSDSIQNFIEYWELNKSKLSIVGSVNNAITITTIHKSKGLQYPIVIVPEANWNFKFMVHDTLWVHLDEVKYPELTLGVSSEKLKIASLSPNKELKETKIYDQIHKEEELFFLEALNMLYVALTRAEERLYILASYKTVEKKDTKTSENSLENNAIAIKNISDILYYYLDEIGIFDSSRSEYILNQGNRKVNAYMPPKTNSIRISPENYNLTNSPKVKISELSDKSSGDFENIEWGNKIHKILSEIIAKNDIQLAVNKAITAGIIDEKEKGEIILKLDELLNLDQISKYFEFGVQVKNEMEILLPDGNVLRPDRVNFSQNETVIIDYKTGHDLPQHHSQLRVYGNLLKEMGYPNPKMILVYLSNLKIVEVN